MQAKAKYISGNSCLALFLYGCYYKYHGGKQEKQLWAFSHNCHIAKHQSDSLPPLVGRPLTQRQAAAEATQLWTWLYVSSATAALLGGEADHSRKAADLRSLFSSSEVPDRKSRSLRNGYLPWNEFTAVHAQSTLKHPIYRLLFPPPEMYNQCKRENPSSMWWIKV